MSDDPGNDPNHDTLHLGVGLLTPINPQALGAPRGYSNGMLAPAGGRLLFVAGQIGWDDEQRVVDGGFVAQFGKALDNVLEVVRGAGGGPGHVASLTVYVTDRDEYLASLAPLGVAWRERMGRHFPAMALVQVAGLVEPAARVEIQGIAMLPGGAAASAPSVGPADSSPGSADR